MRHSACTNAIESVICSLNALILNDSNFLAMIGRQDVINQRSLSCTEEAGDHSNWDLVRHDGWSNNV